MSNSINNKGNVYLSNDKLNLLTKNNELKGEIKKLIKKIIEGKIRFPLKKFFTSEKKILKNFNELKRIGTGVLKKEYDLYGYIHKNRKAKVRVKKNNEEKIKLMSENELMLFNNKSPILIPHIKKNQKKYSVIVDFFIEYGRILSRRKDEKKSPYEYWMTKSMIKQIVIKALKKYKEINEKTLRYSMYKLFFGASLFKPHVVKKCYELFNAKSVLDMSAGWGVHLLGALATQSVKRYLAYEPNSKLFEGYKNMISFFGDDGNYEIVNKPFEDSIINEYFDLVFSSPPYFDLEIYDSNDIKQSIYKYPKFNDWLEKWLFPSIERLFTQLKNGGHLCIYLNDYENYDICFRMINHISKISNCFWVGIIGVEGITGKNRPIWVWRKGDKKNIPIYSL
jgi:hypothetical protein